jgi:hypothetical protein
MPSRRGILPSVYRKNGLFAVIDAQFAVNDAPNARTIGHTLFSRGLFAALRAPNAARRVRDD